MAVVGYPSHNIGDPATFRPGLVVSSRMQHGVRRQITNAGIIASMSGGPVVDGSGAVVSVAVTGADSEATSVIQAVLIT